MGVASALVPKRSPRLQGSGSCLTLGAEALWAHERLQHFGCQKHPEFARRELCYWQCHAQLTLLVTVVPLLSPTSYYRAAFVTPYPEQL